MKTDKNFYLHEAYFCRGKQFNLHHVESIYCPEPRCAVQLQYLSCHVTDNRIPNYRIQYYSFFFFLIVCFTSYFVFCIAVLPQSPGVVYYLSIVETRDQSSRGCPLLFSNRNLGSFCAQETEILYTHSLWEVVDHSRSKMHETCLIIIHDPQYETGHGIEPGTFGLAYECSTTELILLLLS